MRLLELVQEEVWNYFDISLKNPKLLELEERDSKGNSLLHLVILKNKCQYIGQLVKWGIKVNWRNKWGHTPLHTATEVNNIVAVEELIEREGEINGKDLQGQSAIFIALKNDRPNIFNFLKRKGAKLDLQDNNGSTLLHIAAEYNSYYYIPQLTSVIDKTDSIGKTAVMIAITHNHAKFAEILLKYGAEANITDSKGNSTLHLAVLSNNISLVNLCLRYKVHPDVMNMDGTTPLHFAVEKNFRAAVDLLLVRGANINLQDEDYYSALHIACKQSYKPIINVLIVNGADTEATTFNGDTPLLIAAGSGNMPAFITLLSAGVYLEHRNNDGRNVLHQAFESGAEDIVRSLMRMRPGLNDFMNYDILSLVGRRI